jgi:hypothetical protein
MAFFSQREQLINSIGPKTHVLGHFGPFLSCTKVDVKLAELVPLTHESRCKTHVLGCFRPFRYGTKVDAKLAELAPLTHKFAKESRV